MKLKRMLLLYCVTVLWISMASCDGKKLKWGASSDKKFDSLFLGISLGMEKTAFYDHCWDYNKKKIFTHSPTNQAVEYVLAKEFDHPVMMRFYPTFYTDRIVEMPVTFSYQAWAPWNKQYGSDELFLKMLPVFKKWYGEDFKILEHPRMGRIYVKMDGKRRINLFIRDDQFVQAVFTDLELEKARKAEEEKTPDEGSKN